MLHSEDRTRKITLLKRSPAAFLKEFSRDEEGGIIILTLFLLIIMLVLGGMAVDFMRFESRRALLQSVSDRAVLSAASLDQTLDGEEVIIDFFEKAGFGGSIIGTPVIKKEPGQGSSEVSVESRIDVNTFYLRLIGIDQLSAPAESAARQGTGNIEISLVLDISGSMRNRVPAMVATIDDATGEPVRDADGNVVRTRQDVRKIELLQAAATDFIDDMIIDDLRDKVSINLIAYSQQVALDDDLYKLLRTTPDSISESGETGSSFSGPVSAGGYATLPDDPDATIDTSWANGERVYTNPSRCIDFEAADFESAEFDLTKTYDQVEYFEHYSSGDSGIDYPVCPQEEYESILLLSQDAFELKRRINEYQPTSFTSIHLGVKWGISLLDPALRPLLGKIDSLDDAFQGDRPAEYTGDTLKYLIVMTDGVNVASRRIEDDDYDSYEERVRWSEYPMDYWRNNIAGDPRPSRDSLTYNPGSVTQFDTWMETLCNDAKLAPNRIEIFTIAMGEGAGASQLGKCASGAGNAFATDFNTDGDDPGIDEIFQTIARQITALRLNL